MTGAPSREPAAGRSDQNHCQGPTGSPRFRRLAMQTASTSAITVMKIQAMPNVMAPSTMAESRRTMPLVTYLFIICPAPLKSRARMTAAATAWVPGGIWMTPGRYGYGG